LIVGCPVGVLYCVWPLLLVVRSWRCGLFIVNWITLLFWLPLLRCYWLFIVYYVIDGTLLFTHDCVIDNLLFIVIVGWNWGTFIDITILIVILLGCCCYSIVELFVTITTCLVTCVATLMGDYCWVLLLLLVLAIVVGMILLLILLQWCIIEVLLCVYYSCVYYYDIIIDDDDYCLLLLLLLMIVLLLMVLLWPYWLCNVLLLLLIYYYCVLLLLLWYNYWWVIIWLVAVADIVRNWLLFDDDIEKY